MLPDTLPVPSFALTGTDAFVTLVGTEQLIDFGSAETWTEAKPYMMQRIFGALVKLAAPVVMEYHGDLFHDASFIRDEITGPCTFYFAVRASGTHITFDGGFMRSVAAANRHPDYRLKMYRMRLVQGGTYGRTWYLHADEFLIDG